MWAWDASSDVPGRPQASRWLSPYVIPSGKRTKNDGKSPFWMVKSTISTGPFSIAMFVYQRVWENGIWSWSSGGTSKQFYGHEFLRGSITISGCLWEIWSSGAVVETPSISETTTLNGCLHQTKNSWWVQGATVNPSFQKPDNLNKSLHQLGSIVILVSHEIPLKPDQFVVTPCLDDLWFTWFKNGGFVSIPTLKKSQSVNREIIPGRCVFNQNYSLKATLTIIIGVSWNFWATPKSSQYPMDFD